MIGLLVGFLIGRWTMAPPRPERERVNEKRGGIMDAATAVWLVLFVAGVGIFFVSALANVPVDVWMWLGEYAADIGILTILVVAARRRLTRQATVATVVSTQGGTQ